MDFSIPDWVEHGEKTTRGLDLVGLRNPVQNIVVELLNGVTTITPSVRYLSIRAMTARAYVKAQLPDNSTLFREFSAKLEAAVAIGNLLVDPRITGVLGSTKAALIISEAPAEIELERLVEQLAINIYTGPSEQLDISYLDATAVPGLTSEIGLELTEELIGHCATTDFGKRILAGDVSGRIPFGELGEFGEKVYLAGFAEAERTRLINAIIPVAPTEKHKTRTQTYLLLLRLAERLKRPPTEDDVIRAALDGSIGLPVLEEILDGWLAFTVRDAIAAGHEYVLQEVTRELEIRGRVLYPANELISAILSRNDEVAQPLINLKIFSLGESVHSLSVREVFDRVIAATSLGTSVRSGLTRWNDGLDELDLFRQIQAKPTRAGALALLPIVWMMAMRRTSNDDRGAFTDLLSRGGKMRLSVGGYITPTLTGYLESDASFLVFAAELAAITVRQHLRIAWRRFEQDSSKLIAVINTESDRWSFRSRFDAGRASSRIAQAVSWLEQLGLIGPDGLTDLGAEHSMKVIASLENEGENV